MKKSNSFNSIRKIPDINLIKHYRKYDRLPSISMSMSKPGCLISKSRGMG